MKVRSAFVANSSSSSFILFNLDHPAIKKMIDEGMIDEGDTTFTDYNDNELWNWCSKNNFDWDEFAEQISFNG